MKYAAAPMPRNQMVLIPKTLDDVIPTDHPIRLLDELLGLLDWSAFEQDFRRDHRGRPPLDPRILAAVWIYAYYRKVDSSRSLEYQLRTNIEFMWLAHGHKIDHTTLSEFRRKHGQAVKALNRSVVELARSLKVTKLSKLYIDGSRIRANSSRYHTLTAEKATQLLELIDKQITEFHEKCDLTDQMEDLFDDGIDGDKLPPELAEMKARKEQLEAIRDQCKAMDEQRRKHCGKSVRTQAQIPKSDPDSRILPNKEGGYAPNYTPVIGVEGGLGLIVTSHVDAIANEQDMAIALVDDVETSYGVTVDTVGADAAYSTAMNIVELEEKRGKNFLAPHSKGDVDRENPALRDDPSEPVAESDWPNLPRNPSTKKFGTEAFIYDAEEDVHYCPMGRKMHRVFSERKQQSNGQSTRLTRYQSSSCDSCAALALCRKKADAKQPRVVTRSEHAEVIERHREKMSTEEAKQAYGPRFYFAESPYGHIKEHYGMREFRTRGNEAVESEFGLVQLTHNAFRMLRAPVVADFLRGRQRFR